VSSFNLSELFESVVDVVPDRVALHTPARTLTFAELDARANQLAHHLEAVGVGAGDHIGLQLLNGTEYIEGMLAAFKLRAVPVNVNYRYVERELAYLYENADLVALLVNEQFAALAEAARTPMLRHIVVLERDYEDLLAAQPTARDWTGRSGDDRYIAYTGGTTGMPKGVVWRHEDIFFAAMGGGDPTLDKGPITTPEELPGRVTEWQMAQMYTPPLMHVSAHWGAFNGFFGGTKVVLGSPGAFDPAEIWALVGEQGVTALTVVGDAMARPLLDHLAAGNEANTGMLFVFASGGAILSPSTKAMIAELLPNVMVLDTFGSSETGMAGSRGKDDATFTMDDRTTVLDEGLRPVAPGSGTIGKLARQGHVPLGYHKDEEKSAATMVTIDGKRWVLPGDMATIEADGTITLLGRGSGCINTGGEKVFPEEVEQVLKGNAAIQDVLVVGVPDDRWGEKVVAVVQARPLRAVELADVQATAREGLAGYKVPRDLVMVDEIVRGPNGKPDYGWAKQTAAEALTT
jgi:acyl-CoA synthetase (AMP-forming)/AMP-acid ligase II